MKSLTIWGEEGYDNSHIEEIIKGIKSAFCSPLAWYGMIEGEPETSVGDRMILKDPSGKDRILIEITEIRHMIFGEIDETIARAVLDCDVQDFRDAHRFYWEEELANDDIEMNNSLPIVAEFFRILEIY